MAGTEVSSVIRDILDAFKNGFNLVKSTGRKHKRRHTEPSNSANDESRLHQSLSVRSEEIKQAYEKSVVRHGRQFEVGDSKSQSSLAQILLVLNTGLIKLLNHALSSDSKARSQSRSSLCHLSETTALDTLNALSELNIRLISSSRVDLQLGLVPPNDRHKASAKQTGRPRAESISRPSRRPPVSPQLKNGGWVRSKSSPSVVSFVPSSTSSRKRDASKSPPVRHAQLAARDQTPKRQHSPATIAAMDNLAPLPKINSAKPDLVRHPSMYIVPSDFFNALPQPALPRYEAQQVHPIQEPPARPPKVPLHSRPQVAHTSAHVPSKSFEGRVRPPSMMTFMTASTKIGEIPEHKLPDRTLTREEQERLPMPYVVPAMVEPTKKRTGRGLKFWKKDKQERGMVGAVGA